MTKIFENISEIIGWTQIAISPTLIGVIAGIFIYYSNPSTGFLILSIFAVLLGLIVGVLLATKILKSKKGTVWFLSRTSSSELDNSEEEN